MKSQYLVVNNQFRNKNARKRKYPTANVIIINAQNQTLMYLNQN